MNDASELAAFELRGALAPELFVHEGRPGIVFERPDTGWVAASLTGETPLGLHPIRGEVVDFLLDLAPEGELDVRLWRVELDAP